MTTICRREMESKLNSRNITCTYSHGVFIVMTVPQSGMVDRL